MKTLDLHFSVDGEHFENGAFKNDDVTRGNHVISLTEFSANTNPRSPLIVELRVQILRRSVDGKHLMGSKSETSHVVSTSCIITGSAKNRTL